jgi:cellulose synthase (UDP-forming)
MKTYPDRPDAISRLIRVLILCLTAFLFFQFISIHLSWRNQIILGSASMVLGLVANRLSSSRIVTLALMMFSLAATFRYGWWRIAMVVSYFSNENNQRVTLDAFFLLILLCAEAYTALIMILGYMQTAWPLHRKPIPMPSDASAWPHVDLLIPTYNEPLALVRYTALAAINIDYPPDKLHVYILDDGSRSDFEEFAREAGIGYLTRAEHHHAKAGNINHALSTMSSPFVAIFDCDHVPTRSFLQMTMGWMLADKKMAMLQTPHHFYSPDPFERNLLQYKTIPNEAELFYGIIQDGNDFWNATFFCGSCALLRRSALDEVGGIAVETVTEDAHTSLRMQKRGYNTAYINIPQAAGLATETLAAHVGQRVRWARGMIQILRTDNPLLGRGMKFTQRLCYLNAMLHFMDHHSRLLGRHSRLCSSAPGSGQPHQLPRPGQVPPFLLERNLRGRPGPLYSAAHPVGPDQSKAGQVQCHGQGQHAGPDHLRQQDSGADQVDAPAQLRGPPSRPLPALCYRSAAHWRHLHERLLGAVQHRHSRRRGSGRPGTEAAARIGAHQCKNRGAHRLPGRQPGRRHLHRHVGGRRFDCRVQ